MKLLPESIVQNARTDVQDAISLVNELRVDLVRTTEKIDTVLNKLSRAETQLYVAAQPRGRPRTVRLSDGTLE